jgi:hypothetical protein
MADTEKLPVVQVHVRPDRLERSTMDVWTVMYIVAVIAMSILYDLVTWKYRGVDTTITYTFRSIAYSYPIISIMAAFSCGMIFGHIFWCGYVKH